MAYRPATQQHREALEITIRCLKSARDCAKKADCPGLLKKIRSAIKSAGGAERNMIGRLMHTNSSK